MTTKRELDAITHIVELLDDRPEDMYDEEGTPTEELNRAVASLRNIIRQTDPSRLTD
jgi:hypothetical protein